ncbi:MAG TPA: TadE/TadG family type IV pilus assembly protein [Caulobacteraceae bacterium]
MLRAFRADRRGGAAVILAVCIGALAMLAAGGVEMAELFGERAKMKGVADAAALWGATELTMSTQSGVEARAQAFALKELTSLPDTTTVTVKAEVVAAPDKKKALKVSIHGNRPSYFGSLFPPGGFNIDVSSTALSLGKRSLCVFAHGTDALPVIDLQNTSKITAPGCMVHGNDDLRVAGGGLMSAGVIQTVGTAAGPVTPSAETGAKTIPNPFASISFPGPEVCAGKPGKKVVTTYEALGDADGVTTWCSAVQVEGTGHLHLNPGVHYFTDTLSVKDTAKLTGTDVVLVFDDDSRFSFNGTADVQLEGRKKGIFAGFVVYVPKTNSSDFIIDSDHVSKLLGTLYMPAGRLVLGGVGKIAEQSAWTVVVTRTMLMKGSANLYINADYGGTPVPVPNGVGPYAGATRLTH